MIALLTKQRRGAHEYLLETMVDATTRMAH